jgi:pSer/pThr/pTyr-binding forkhead associated (FHA) protein
MHAKLTGRAGQAAGMVFHVMEEATIGSNADSTIRLKAGIVSDRHARIIYDPKKECYFLEDLKSFNGTRLDGEDIRGKKKRLQKYHIISFANLYEFTYQVVPDTDSPASQSKPAVPASEEAKMARTIVIDYGEMMQQMPEAKDALFVEFRTTKGGDQTVRLKEGENSVGRLSSADVMIDNPSISRHHAVIVVRGDTVLVRDAGSRNGTFVDEQKVEQETEVPSTAEVRFGLVRAVMVRKPVEPGKH